MAGRDPESSGVPFPDSRGGCIKFYSHSQNVCLTSVKVFLHQDQAPEDQCSRLWKRVVPAKGPDDAGCGAGTPSPSATSKAPELVQLSSVMGLTTHQQSPGRLYNKEKCCDSSTFLFRFGSLLDKKYRIRKDTFGGFK